MKKMIFCTVLAGVMFFCGCTGRGQTEYHLSSEESMTEGDGKGTGSSSGSSEPSSSGSSLSGEEKVRSDSRIWVYICGAVQKPGVYSFPDGSRVCEALAAAGGFTQEADSRSLNQAQRLTDGQQITVLTREETAGNLPGSADQTGSSGMAGSSKKVNINTAGKEELMTLSGIGEARAEDIIAYREQNGGFSGIEDIQNVSGIKQKAFEKIKDQIEV